MNAGDEMPVYQINSVLDWLDHRKYKHQSNQQSAEKKYQRNLEKFNQIRKQ